MPACSTSAISAASSLTVSAWMPKAAPPASDSPLSFSRIRLYLGTGFGRWFRARIGGCGVSDFESRESRDRDVLPQLSDLGLDQLAHGESVLFDERLLEEAHLFVIFRQASLDDAV